MNTAHTEQPLAAGKQDDLGFDPDSPDVSDPQVDPVGPAEAPASGEDLQKDKRVKDAEYPPYDTDR